PCRKWCEIFIFPDHTPSHGRRQLDSANRLGHCVENGKDNRRDAALFTDPAVRADMQRRPVASLWIGERLNYINQLCLLSHVQHGHPTTLYCTDTVENVPEGVMVRRADEIM